MLPTYNLLNPHRFDLSSDDEEPVMIIPKREATRESRTPEEQLSSSATPMKKGNPVKYNNLTVLVLVGREKCPFFIDYKDIQHRSPYLETRLKGPWKETQERCVELRELDAKLFGRYMFWISCGKMPMKKDDYPTLAKLYALGGTLKDNKFEDHVMLALMELNGNALECPPVAAVNTFYAVTKEGSPVRKYLVDMWVAHGTVNNHLPSAVTDLTPYFVDDLLRAFMTDAAVPRIATSSAQRLQERSDVYFKNPGAGKVVKSEDEDEGSL